MLLAGDYAFDWGTNIGRVRLPDGSEREQRTKLLRVLKREPGGEWKVQRTMWNAAPAAGDES